MNKKQLEMHNAIVGTERMSGLDGYDDMEGQNSFFEGNDFSGVDGEEGYGEDADCYSGAAGMASKPVLQSDPYVISYENTDGVNHTATLFGYNDNFGAVNYGNDATITITNLQGGTYGRLLAQSNNKNFQIGKWRFQSSDPAQLIQTVNINHVDANGKSYSVPLNLSILRDSFQFQPDILDVNRIVSIDGNTNLTWNLLAGSTLTIAMFPVKIFSTKGVLNGAAGMTQFKARKLSGGNAAPVIIQTTQDVKSITGRS